MSDQANPVENTEENTDVTAENPEAPVDSVQSAEALETEFAEQGETVDEPREGEFEPSDDAPFEAITAEPSDAEPSDAPASDANTVAPAESEQAETAMVDSFAEQDETVQGSNTFVAGAGSAAVVEADDVESVQTADASSSETVSSETVSSETVSSETGSSETSDAASDSQSVQVERTSGPAMFELPERMARNRRIYDAKIEDIHYKNIPMLVRFLDTYGRILSRRRTGVSAKMQRRVVQSVKLARELSLLPYTNEHNRLSRKNR